MKARKKPLEVLTPEALGVDVSPRLKMLKFSEPPRRSTGIQVKDVAELLSKLEESGVLE
jgi:electron transfer flavoprotein beta subunit